MASPVAETRAVSLPREICEEFVAGFCTRGDQCPNRHEDVDFENANSSSTILEPSANLKTPRLSPSPEPFRPLAHPTILTAQKVVPPQRKSCEDFAAGFCPNGDDCPDAHGDTDVVAISAVAHPVANGATENDMDEDALPSEPDGPLDSPPPLVVPSTAPSLEGDALVSLSACSSGAAARNSSTPPSNGTPDVAANPHCATNRAKESNFSIDASASAKRKSSVDVATATTGVSGLAGDPHVPTNRKDDVFESVDPYASPKRKASLEISPAVAKRSRKLPRNGTGADSVGEIKPVVNGGQSESRTLKFREEKDQKLNGRDRIKYPKKNKHKNKLHVPKAEKEIPDKEKYHCHVCKKDCNTPSNYESHLRGKGHRQAVAKQRHRSENQTLVKSGAVAPQANGVHQAQVADAWGVPPQPVPLHATIQEAVDLPVPSPRDQENVSSTASLSDVDPKPLSGAVSSATRDKSSPVGGRVAGAPDLSVPSGPLAGPKLRKASEGEGSNDHPINRTDMELEPGEVFQDKAALDGISAIRSRTSAKNNVDESVDRPGLARQENKFANSGRFAELAAPQSTDRQSGPHSAAHTNVATPNASDTLDTASPARAPGERLEARPLIEPVPDRNVLRSSILGQKMTRAHWKALRKFAYQGDEYDRLTFKVLQEFLVSPSVGMGFQHLAPFSHVLKHVPHRLDATGNVVANFSDYPSMLARHQDPDKELDKLPSEQKTATLCFADNLMYQFYMRSGDEGDFKVRREDELPSRGRFPQSARGNHPATDDVAEDPLFIEIQRLIRTPPPPPSVQNPPAN